jgi:PilZ domain
MLVACGRWYMVRERGPGSFKGFSTWRRVFMAEDKSSEDRRHHTRFPCEVPFPASFVSRLGSMSAFVDDVSSGGAKLRIKQAHDHVPFLVQGEFEYTFHTNIGTTQCRAKTAWVQRVGSDFVWGIEFIKIGDKSDDPLNVIIRKIQNQAM